MRRSVALTLTTVAIAGAVAVTAYGAVITGTDGYDNGTIRPALRGTGGADQINGLRGNDRLIGRGGADTLDGGPGSDRIDGDGGTDLLRGGGGNDVAEGGTGNDTLEGDSGNDTLRGEAGDDRFDGGSGNDSISGGDGNDRDASGRTAGGSGNDDVAGGPGDDALDGGDGDDVIDGGDGNDFLVEGGFGDERAIVGGPGDDVIDGGRGGDRQLLGGDGNDIIFGGRGTDEIDGGPGNDRIDGGDGQDKVVAAPPSLRGGDGNDVILGGTGADQLDGGAGDDLLFGGSAPDIVDGGPGFDVCLRDANLGDPMPVNCEVVVDSDPTTAGQPPVNPQTGVAAVFFDPTHPGIVAGGAEGKAKLLANGAVRRKLVQGTDFDDDGVTRPALVGDAQDEVFTAKEGNDVVTANAGDDELDCRGGNDLCDGGPGNDRIFGGAGDDVLLGGDGKDVIDGGDGVDRIVSGAGDDIIRPGAGDELRPAGAAPGSPADKSIDAGSGDDLIEAVGGGRDTITCGPGIDTVQHDAADQVAADCEIRDASSGTLPAPVIGKSVTVRAVSGVVFVKYPRGASSPRARAAQAGFVPLKGGAVLPVGATVDTRRGRIALTSAAARLRNGKTKTQRAQFYDGVFQIRQRRAAKPVTEILLQAPDFAKTCAGATTASSSGLTGRAARHKKVVSRLWGNGKGRYRTRGRNSAATVRGTIWLTEERCDGTLTRVRSGRVQVFDRVRARSVTLRAGQSYLARAKRVAAKSRRP